jgi:hypothetical protein
MAERSTTRSPSSRLVRLAEQSSVYTRVKPDPNVGFFPYTDEADVTEAVGNFRQYLAILEEWDEREKEKEKAQGKLA